MPIEPITHRVHGRTWHFTPAPIAALRTKDPQPELILRQLAAAFEIAPGLPRGISFPSPVQGTVLTVTIAETETTIDKIAAEHLLYALKGP